MAIHIPLISVTGTKGKTTTVSVIAQVLQALGRDVLKVDTTGHFINGERKSTLEDSKNGWGLVPSVAPGRYLWEFHEHLELVSKGVAVLECSLGCSASSGLAYRYHKVGVFLNVFEDHLGSSDRINNREDIAKAKDFIFRRLGDDSYAVFNADDELVCDTLKVLPKTKSYTLIPCGIDFSYYDIDLHLSNGGVAFTVDNNKQLIRAKAGDTVLADLKHIPWTFNGTFLPSLWNLMQAAAAMYGFYDGVLPIGFRKALESARLDPYGGRLTLLKNSKGVTMLADHAHEKTSLTQVAELARTLTQKDGKIIGVVRLAHDRSDALLHQTGKTIGEAYDEVVVYDKIDGVLRKPQIHKGRFPQITGRTSEIVATGASKTNKKVTRIVREDEAIAYAAKLAHNNDVVVVIVNDDIEQSIAFIQKYFNAEFV